MATAQDAAHPAGTEPALSGQTAVVDGVELKYLAAGSGPPLILLHGYTETSHMWEAVIPHFARAFRVVAPDLPGIGGSAIPSAGLDMKAAAIRIHDLAQALHIRKARIVGHDIGLMVAYAYAALYPDDVDRLVVMDAFLPGIGDWETYYHNPRRWHFLFNGPTAEALVEGRERIYFDHFWNDFAADGKRSLSDGDRRLYAAAYARPGRMRAAWAYFAALPRTAEDFKVLARTKLTMPVLSISGARAAGDVLGQHMKLVASNVEIVVREDTGHWVLQERPEQTIAALDGFLAH
jgi:pimeloyl-ACP methyl ester carboxylesterase